MIMTRSCLRRDNRDLKHRQRNARRRGSQPKKDWVEGFQKRKLSNVLFSGDDEFWVSD